MEQKTFSVNVICGHCANRAPMEIIYRRSQLKDYRDSHGGLEWEEGYVYELLLCPACSGITLRRHYWHDFREPDQIMEEVLFPTETDLPPGLPKNIKREYLAALQVRNVSPNSYGVLLGRLLEMVCEDRGLAAGA